MPRPSVSSLVGKSCRLCLQFRKCWGGHGMRNPAPGSRSGKRSCHGASPVHINKSSGRQDSRCPPVGCDLVSRCWQSQMSPVVGTVTTVTVSAVCGVVGIRTHCTQHGDRKIRWVGVCMLSGCEVSIFSLKSLNESPKQKIDSTQGIKSHLPVWGNFYSTKHFHLKDALKNILKKRDMGRKFRKSYGRFW